MLVDASLGKDDIDAYFTIGMPLYEHGLTWLIMSDYPGLDVNYAGLTDYGIVVRQLRRARGQRGSGQEMRHRAHDARLTAPLGAVGGQPRTMQDSFKVIYGATTLSKYTVADEHNSTFRSKSTTTSPASTRR